MAKNSIRQRIPNFADGGSPETAEFGTIEELLLIPWVAQWMQVMDGVPFLRFSKSKDILMVEHGQEKQESFWAVGYLKDPGSVDLPEWVNQQRI